MALDATKLSDLFSILKQPSIPLVLYFPLLSVYKITILQLKSSIYAKTQNYIFAVFRSII